VVLGVERDIEVAAACCLGNVFVFALGVDDDDFGIEHEGPDNLELGGIGLARACLGEDDRVIVLEAEAVEEDEG